MFLMYIDESGDSGLNNSPTRYYVLTGLVIHELRWRDCLDELIRFRRAMKTQYGLRLREEFHASKFITRPRDLVRIRRHDRLAMIRSFAGTVAGIRDINIINIVVDKQGKAADYDVIEMAWTALIQRFENTIRFRNFPGPQNADERGMLFCDHTTDKKIEKLIRRMRQYNPIPNQAQFASGYRNIPLSYIIEDPNFRDSAHSYFVQAVDLVSFLMYQQIAPNSYMKKNSGQNYFQRLKPIFCTHASSTNREGIVRL